VDCGPAGHVDRHITFIRADLMPCHQEHSHERPGKLVLIWRHRPCHLGMSYGLWYAYSPTTRHWNAIGHSLSSGFQAAAERNLAGGKNSLLQYRQGNTPRSPGRRALDTDRPSCSLIVRRLGFCHVHLPEKVQTAVAWAYFLAQRSSPWRLDADVEGHGFAARSRRNPGIRPGNNSLLAGTVLGSAEMNSFVLN